MNHRWQKEKFVHQFIVTCTTVVNISILSWRFPSFLVLIFQKCYEQKQYKNGLKFAKQILSNAKFAEHGGKYDYVLNI
jgi:hypothetical protein